MPVPEFDRPKQNGSSPRSSQLLLALCLLAAVLSLFGVQTLGAQSCYQSCYGLQSYGRVATINRVSAVERRRYFPGEHALDSPTPLRYQQPTFADPDSVELATTRNKRGIA